MIYALLVGASALVQSFSGDPPPPPPELASVTLPAFDRFQEISGRVVLTTFRRSGTGDETILLLHGSPGSLRSFDDLEPILARSMQVISIDLPGFGHSRRDLPDYGIDSHAAYVLALMDSLGIDAAHVLGFSMGSGVALHMADEAPERVKSLIFLGGIGVQEGEGSGDYHFEHLKYRVGWLALVAVPELLPHFGLLGDRVARRAFIRNFMDSDQRPLRGILERLTQPLLILHGATDFLVPVRAAFEHHRIVEHSELVVFDDDGHFMIFTGGAGRLAEEIVPFVRRSADTRLEPIRRTVSSTPPPSDAATDLPGGLSIERGMSPWAQAGVIAAATYVLEDPTTIITGLLIRDGQIDLFVGLFALIFGIFTGDLLLYAIGRCVGGRLLRWPTVARWMPTRQLDRMGGWLDRYGWTAVLASRFLPGTRFPLYVAAGALAHRPLRFAMWTFAAVLIWAPAMMLMVIFLGEAAASPIRSVVGGGWPAILLLTAILLMVLHNLPLLFMRFGRARLIARFSRLWRWEFWPAAVFYAPLVPYVAWLGARHRGVNVITAANPGFPLGGLVGESKYDILQLLPPEWIIASARIEPGEIATRMTSLGDSMRRQGWTYPIVLKPDAGERGAGVRLVMDDSEASDYLELVSGPILAQTYHPGPFEAGIFYVRDPEQPRGRIFSVTDKHFPKLIADGRRSIEQLIWRDRRFRMQAGLFLNRLGERRNTVEPAGEVIRLAIAGNHCQGTRFSDGGHLVTPALTDVIDEISRGLDGFLFGRFDVRYADADALMAGRGFAIVELNGITGESTDIYDPSGSLAGAYLTLFRQWGTLFAIGSANRRAGIRPASHREMVRALWRHYVRGQRVRMISD